MAADIQHSVFTIQYSALAVHAPLCDSLTLFCILRRLIARYEGHRLSAAVKPSWAWLRHADFLIADFAPIKLAFLRHDALAAWGVKRPDIRSISIILFRD